MRVLEIPPRPSSLIESMRAIGYSLGTALADLVDNCIAAGANTIQIFSSPDAADLKVGILDDGVGMTEDELLEAMRLGSRNPAGGKSAVRSWPFWARPEDGLILPMSGAHCGDANQRSDGECPVELGPHCRVRYVAGPDT